VQTIEANILEKLSGKQNLSVTLLSVTQQKDGALAKAYVNQLSKMFSHQEVIPKVVPSTDASSVILEEVQKNYDLLILGASARNRGGNVLFTPIVDYLVRMSPVLTMVVKGERIQPNWVPRRILVPTNGSRAARNAAELGFRLSSTDGEVILLHVVPHVVHSHHLDTLSEDLNRQLEIGQKIVHELAGLGEEVETRIDKMVKVGGDPETVILQLAQEREVDLIILGTDVRIGSERLFLGPRVEYILANSICPVVVINS
jgi:nucleotide-binding universal stress UspA family protein